MRVAVIGSRNITQVPTNLFSEHIPSECSLLISGGAVGIDQLIEEYAQQKKIPIQVILPDYQHYGRKAPLIRNTQIVTLADYVIAIWDYSSKGTAFVIQECVRLNKKFMILKPD